MTTVSRPDTAIVADTAADFTDGCHLVVEALKLKEGDEIEITVAGTRRFEIARDRRREEAIKLLRALKRPLPEGFKFDRDEANER